MIPGGGRLVALSLAVLAIFGATLQRTPNTTGAYEALLPNILVPSPDTIFGYDAAELASTYGLVLSAATAAHDDATAALATDWLIIEMGPSGWGIPWTWDPFGDGSLTPADTPNANMTALAIDGLLDHGVDDIEARKLGRVLMSWVRTGWSDGFFWLSLAPQDAIYTPHVSALLAGVAARFVAEHGEVLTILDRELLEDRIRASFERLGTGDAGYLRWRYSAVHEVVNDLNYHGYILWGAERAREAGFDIPWSRQDALDTLREYDGLYPIDTPQTPSTAGRYGTEWQLSGTGEALIIAAAWGGEAAPWARKTCVVLEQVPVLPRFAAAALLGFALAGMCNCPEATHRQVPAVGC